MGDLKLFEKNNAGAAKIRIKISSDQSLGGSKVCRKSSSCIPFLGCIMELK
jgi:hypothetical protein